jgi:UDP-GlcNAc3NAcA epimerase
VTPPGAGGPRILTVVGARPQFVKAAAIARAVEEHNAAVPAHRMIRDVLVHTGQHYDYAMSELFFQELGLPRPDFHLGIGSGSHGAQTGAMLREVERVLMAEPPDVVLVYGDTNSTLAGALAAAKLGIRIAHVEAGLRSYNRCMPEEINRVLTDRLSAWLFCPTETAVHNLAREGVVEGVALVGDVMYELLRDHAATAPPAPLLARLGIDVDSYVLATVHRAENTAEPTRLRGIFEALAALARTLPVVVPLHPRTREAFRRIDTTVPATLHVVEPVGYLEMLALERDAQLVLTDSGGVQKEAYWLGVPCVTLRDETEWPETLAGGRNVLGGADPERIRALARDALMAAPRGRPRVEPEGAARAIVAALGDVGT